MGSDSDQPAARLGDIDTGHPPAPPTPIITGSPNVFINGRPAARQDDMLAPHHPGIRTITGGSGSVFINGKSAARVSDSINCGGRIITGSTNVSIGNSPRPLRNAQSREEFSENIKAILDSDSFLDDRQRTQLAADIAVKYRGTEGAIATWHDYFMSNDPEPGDMNDPAKKQGLKRANIERGLVSDSQGAIDANAFTQSISRNQPQLPPSVTSSEFFSNSNTPATPTSHKLLAPEDYKTKRLAEMYSHENLAKYNGEFGASAAESLRDGLIAEAQGVVAAKVIGAGIKATAATSTLFKEAVSAKSSEKFLSKSQLSDWYKKQGEYFSDVRKLESHVEGTDFSKPVTLRTLPENTELIQYVRESGKPGMYFAKPGTPMQSLGIQEPPPRMVKKFLVKEPIEVIESTAATLEKELAPGVGGTGGGQQLIFPKNWENSVIEIGAKP